MFGIKSYSRFHDESVVSHVYKSMNEKLVKVS